MSGVGDITCLLADWNSGDQAAFDRLVPILYDELHRIASHHMRGERPGHVLQTTAVVHEAYLRLIGRQNVSCQTRTEFLAIAAQTMRRVLIDYARGRDRSKRGDGISPVVLGETAVISEDRIEELIAIQSALESLSAFDPRKGRVFELRYFGGMSVEEVAGVLRISPVTVARDWRMAKVWLRRQIGSGSPHAT